MNLVSAKCPNQLVQNGNFESASGWASAYSAILTVSNNELNIVPVTSSSERIEHDITFVSGHKYYASVDILTNYLRTNASIAGYSPASSDSFAMCDIAPNVWTRLEGIRTANNNDVTFGAFRLYYALNSYDTTPQCKMRNCKFIDLTELYGAGNEPTTVAQFKADFPLDYYPYRATSQEVLLSLNGGLVAVS